MSTTETEAPFERWAWLEQSDTADGPTPWGIIIAAIPSVDNDPTPKTWIAPTKASMLRLQPDIDRRADLAAEGTRHHRLVRLVIAEEDT